jgi:hypothetical protein
VPRRPQVKTANDNPVVPIKMISVKIEGHIKAA